VTAARFTRTTAFTAATTAAAGTRFATTGFAGTRASVGIGSDFYLYIIGQFGCCSPYNSTFNPHWEKITRI
jgi:hypothetical protein